MKKTTLHITILIGAAILFVGCAVLTVDVDVYKGPLANHKDVQTEQMAAMAIGAKPLLVELRDALEGKDPNRQNELYRKRDAAGFREKGKKECWYKPAHIAPLSDGKSRFVNQNADRINDILALYNDSPRGIQDKVVLSYINKLKVNHDRFNDIRAVMRPDRQGDRLFWEKYSKHFYTKTNHPVLQPLNQNIEELEIKRKEAEVARDKAIEDSDPNNVRKYGKQIEKFDKLKKPLIKLKEAIEEKLEQMQLGYRELLYPDYPKAKSKRQYRYIHSIAQAHEQIMNLERKVLDTLKTTELKIGAESIKIDEIIQGYSKRNGEIKDLLEEITHKGAVPEGTNARFEWLQNDQLIGAHVDFLFKDLGELQRKHLIGRVNLIARGFIERLSVMDESLRLTLKLIEYINNKKGEGIINATVLKDATIKLALSLIKSEFLYAAITNEHASDDTIAIRCELWNILPKEAEDLSRESGWDRQRMKNYKDALLHLLRKDPSTTSRRLYNTHLFFMVGPYKQCSSAGNNKYANPSIRRFGIVLTGPDKVLTGPDKNDEDGADLIIVEGYTGIEEAVKGVFGGGRLPYGLETLIERYLEEANVCDPNDYKLHYARKQLSDALVRFAQKVLFIANNNSLISPPKEPGLVGLGSAVVRGILGDRIRDKLYKSLNWKIPGDTAVYTRILQAVGNSILVQADALQQERKHRERLEDHYEKEATILADTLDRMSPVNRNSTGINSVKDKLSEYTTAKDVRDIWIKLLQYEHDLALYYGETKRAKEINEALEAARKKREGMIFIRPAMAYLRTSFPATSLQNNPNLTWDNMLGGHMMRSIPFGSQIGEFFNPDAKRDARINAEIDKQFWQNINRVRVAGGGFINYAVVKDDIGNWYVKGYSANPEDIIKSAKSLAFFAAGAKSGANLLPGAESDKGKKPDGGKVDDADSTKSGLERAFIKYKKGYIQQTQTDYDRLKEAISSNTGIERQIREVWEQNTDIGVDVLKQLNKEMKSAAMIHLKEVRKDVGKKHDDPTEQITLIFKGLGALRRFHNDLVSRIKAPDLPAGQGEKKIADSDGATKEIPEEKQRAKRAEKAAINAVTSAVRSRVVEILKRRRDVVGDYETALMVIGQATGQQE